MMACSDYIGRYLAFLVRGLCAIWLVCIGSEYSWQTISKIATLGCLCMEGSALIIIFILAVFIPRCDAQVEMSGTRPVRYIDAQLGQIQPEGRFPLLADSGQSRRAAIGQKRTFAISANMPIRSTWK